MKHSKVFLLVGDAVYLHILVKENETLFVYLWFEAGFFPVICAFFCNWVWSLLTSSENFSFKLCHEYLHRGPQLFLFNAIFGPASERAHPSNEAMQCLLNCLGCRSIAPLTVSVWIYNSQLECNVMLKPYVKQLINASLPTQIFISHMGIYKLILSAELIRRTWLMSGPSSDWYQRPSHF